MRCEPCHLHHAALPRACHPARRAHVRLQVLGCSYENTVGPALKALQRQLGLTETELKRLALRNPALLGRMYPESYSYLSALKQLRGPQQLVRNAEKAANAIKPNMKIGTTKTRAQKHAAQSIDAFSAAITAVLRDQLKEFREHMRKLSPFEASAQSARHEQSSTRRTAHAKQHTQHGHTLSKDQSHK